MEKRDIHVVIDSKEKQQQAIEILERHKEPIYEKQTAMQFDETYKFLVFVDNSWFVGSRDFTTAEITLEQLDELLTNKTHTSEVSQELNALISAASEFRKMLKLIKEECEKTGGVGYNMLAKQIDELMFKHISVNDLIEKYSNH